MKLTKLMNADGETVGYFSDYGVERAARQEWNKSYSGFGLTIAGPHGKCRSHEVAIASLELENVESGDSDRVDYRSSITHDNVILLEERIQYVVDLWLRRGASSVEVQRFLINKYRRPGMSARDTDLGGPVDAAGVLYILKIKAPK